MNVTTKAPSDFNERLDIPNADERFAEALSVGERIAEAGVPLTGHLDHAAIFTDPPHLVSGPLRELGYVTGWDARCYPSPVDGHDYINVSARLPVDSDAFQRGWFEYVAIVHPVDEAGRDHMLGQGFGNPFIHHLTWAIQPPERGDQDDFDYAATVLRDMADAQRMIGDALNDSPGTLIAALPERVATNNDFLARVPDLTRDLSDDERQIEAMQGGGFLIQFFVLTGGRIEVALRVGTTQTFNPKSVHKISKDEISAVQK